MTTKQLYSELSYVNHSREKRLYYAKMMFQNPELFPPLLEILFRVDDKISCRAAWLLEFVAREELTALLPYLDIILDKMHTIHLDPAVRPAAKICEYLIEAYYSKHKNKIQTQLTTAHKEKIIENCFDWMINDEKIAPKAYAMNTLYLLGQDFDWIHAELKLILERDFQMQSSGFKARARHIIKKIEQKK